MVQIHDETRIRLTSLVDFHHYLSLYQTLKLEGLWEWKEVSIPTALAVAIGQGDLDGVALHAQSLGIDYLLEGTYLERKIYLGYQVLAKQLLQKEYGDYLRSLTPFMVDLFRQVAKREVMVDLDDYMRSIKKESKAGKSLYRGLQWNQEMIEKNENKIVKTWEKYYGNHFNYDQYISSSHLIKLIVDFGEDQELIEACQKLRQVEKYLRNLAAHEQIQVDERYFLDRMGLTPVQVHGIIYRIMSLIGLNDQRRLEVFRYLQSMIQNVLSEK